MNPRSLVRITLLCVLPLTSTACGWILVSEPPPNHERLNFFTCTQSRVAPGIDIIWTGLSALGAVTVLASSTSEVESNFGYGKATAAGVYIAWGALTGLSGVSGFKKVNECRAAIGLLMERMSRAEGAPSATLNLEALGWRPPQLFPVPNPLDLAPIRLPRLKAAAPPGSSR